MENANTIAQVVSFEGSTKSDGYFDRLMKFLFGSQDIRSSTMSELKVLSVLRVLWVSVKKFPYAVTFALGATVVASLISVIVPVYYKEFFDTTSKGLSVAQAGSILVDITIAILVLSIIEWVGRYISSLMVVRLARDVMVDLRIRAFDHLIGHTHAFYTSVFTGALVQKLGRLPRSYDRIADSIIFRIVPTIVILVGAIIVLIREQAILALVVVVWVIFLIAINYYFAKWKLRYDIYRAELDSKVTGVTADILSNQSAVETHGTYDNERKRHADIARQQMKVAAFTWNVSTFFYRGQDFTIIAVRFLTFFIGIGLWMKGEFPLGMFMLVHSYVFQLTERLWEIGQVVRDLYESFADAKEMVDIMERPHDVIESTTAYDLKNVKGEIEFSNVYFDHNSKPVIMGVDLVIKPGERIAFVGSSGAGKTTLMKFLPRLFDPKEGSVFIDGNDLRDVTLLSLKSAISIVPQDSVLFHRSLMENIRYGRQDASDEEVIEAAKKAHAHEFISAVPYGYKALVGERGVKLSGGERQRVAIARAFLRNAPILILDEATSSLDSCSEALVQDALMKLMENRTTIVIAHRLSTIRRMDRIIVLDVGRIVEDGSHEVLLKKKGAYWKLWTAQQNGFISDEDVMETDTECQKSTEVE